MGNPRIEDLRRRVERDPTSIAFAQLAEEYRRSGELEEAVRVARTGLEQHPLYLSARVTLGRALAELGRFDEAKAEFQQVLAAAPDNLVALRSMANLHQLRRTPVDREPPAAARMPPVDVPVQVAPAAPVASPFDPEPAVSVRRSPIIPAVNGAPTVSSALDEFPTESAMSPDVAEPSPEVADPPPAAIAQVGALEAPEPAPGPAPDPVLAELQGWLAAILMDRESQRSRVKGHF